MKCEHLDLFLIIDCEERKVRPSLLVLNEVSCYILKCGCKLLGVLGSLVVIIWVEYLNEESSPCCIQFDNIPGHYELNGFAHHNENHKRNAQYFSVLKDLVV